MDLKWILINNEKKRLENLEVTGYIDVKCDSVSQRLTSLRSMDIEKVNYNEQEIDKSHNPPHSKDTHYIVIIMAAELIYEIIGLCKGASKCAYVWLRFYQYEYATVSERKCTKKKEKK